MIRLTPGHPRDMMQWMGSIAKCVILRRPDASHASETTKESFCALINPHTCTVPHVLRTRFFSNKAIVYVNLQYRMTTANRRNITNVYRIKRIKPTKTSYAGQTHNAQTHGQKFKSGNRADAIVKTYQINYEKSPARNLPPHVKNEWRPTFQIFRNVTNGRTDQKNLHTMADCSALQCATVGARGPLGRGDP